ncbi:hypothetical protein Tcan_13277 [Toxocara canis]|uniref:Transmembrane protein n=1 Tax=Toxocara canis TaxID=6265 RepID=A0A0B2VWZ7_TOXCA|nr:hypothetical protein Tcan_13277 [Toxocara canis]
MRTINKTAWYILRQNASVCIPKNAYVSKNENRQGGEEVQDDRVESPNHQLVRQSRVHAVPQHTITKELKDRLRYERLQQRIESDSTVRATGLRRHFLGLMQFFTSSAEISTCMSGSAVRKMKRRMRVVLLAWLSLLFYIVLLATHHTIAHRVEMNKRRKVFHEFDARKQ